MKKKKGRFWVFAFESYYPRGGMNDYIFSFNTIEEFEEEIIENSSWRKYQLLDIKTHYHFEADLGDLTKWVCKNVGDEKYDVFKETVL